MITLKRNLNTGLVDGALDDAVERLNSLETGIEAILLAGSFARGDGTEFSDVDLIVYTKNYPKHESYVWFSNFSGKLIHFSIEVQKLTKPKPEIASWSLGFPAVDVYKYIWATQRAKKILGKDPSQRLSAIKPELEDFIEFAAKVKRGQVFKDKILLRYSARMLAMYAPALLIPLNPKKVVSSPIEAAHCALALKKKPHHLKKDFSICFGLEQASDKAIYESAKRLSLEMVDYLNANAVKLLKLNNEHVPLKEGKLKEYLVSIFRKKR